MCSRVLLIGLTSLLITGLLLGGCGPEEVIPEEKSPAVDSETTPTDEKTTLSEPTTAPPRPDTPFITTEEAILFEDNFEDGMADGWALDTGWGVSTDSGNCILSGYGEGFAQPNVCDWTDYTLEARFKLVEGELCFNLRESRHAGLIRYALNVHFGGLELNKQITQDWVELSDASTSIRSN